MLTILLATFALSAEPTDPPKKAGATKTGELVVDSRMPAEILVDGHQVGQLFMPARLEVVVEAGVRSVRVYTNGTPDDIDVVVPVSGSVNLLVGRTGLSIGKTAATTTAEERVAAGPIPIQVRMNDTIGARLTVGDKRYKVGAGQQLDLELIAGRYPISIQSHNGTVVWAHGTLVVDGPDPIVMQLSEGRLPEVTGKGSFASL